MCLKKTVLVLLSCLFVVGACEYNVPLTTDHSIPIDQTILGAWKIVPAGNEDDDTEVRIYEFSDTEYVVHYYEAGGDLYFRAYAIKIGDVSAVQFELIGSNEKPVSGDEDERYLVVKYKISNGLLEVATLNSDVVDDDLSDSESLRNAFIEHKDNPGLFNEPGFFKRIKP